MKEIAQLAGVSSSAVSNWKRRYVDFPQAVDAGMSGEFYDLDVVIAWLERVGRKVMPQDASEKQLWLCMDMLRNRLTMEEALLLMLQVIYVQQSLAFVPDVSGAFAEGEPWTQSVLDRTSQEETRTVWDRAVARLAEEQPELADILRLSPAVDDLLLWGAAIGIARGTFGQPDIGLAVTMLLDKFVNDRSAMSTTPESLWGLFRGLLRPIRGTLYDPAAGQGMLLAALADAAEEPGLKVVGQEVNDYNWRVAYLHLALRGVPPTLAQGDTLRGDRFRDLRADRVVLDGPMGVRLDAGDQLLDKRWKYGFTNAAEWMWVQHVLYHLNDDGIGAVLVPTGCLARAGREAHIRRAIVADGRLEAVIELPPKMLPGFSLSVSLLLLRGAASHTHRKGVLFIDARQLGQTRRGKTHELTPADVERITAAVHAARHGAEADEPLFATMADEVQIELEGFDLTPSRYIRYADTVAHQDQGHDRANVEAQVSLASTELDALVPHMPKVKLGMQHFRPATSAWPLRKLKTLLLDVPRPGTRQDEKGHGAEIPWYPTSAVSSGTVALTLEPKETTRGRPPARLTRSGDLLLVARGVGSGRSVGCAVVDYPDPCAFAESLLLLVPDQEQILPDFLRLALVSASGHRSLTAVTSGSVISNIRPDALGGVEIRVPDLATQQRIVDAMRALEDAQEQMDAAATALRDMSQAFRDEIAAGRYEAGPMGALDDSAFE